MDHFHDLEDALPTLSSEDSQQTQIQQTQTPQTQTPQTQPPQTQISQTQSPLTMDENTQRAIVEQLFRRIQAEAPAAAPTATSDHKKKVPDVPMFSGTRAEYEGFKLNMTYKMRSDALFYPSDDDKILYAFGRTEGKAQTTILPWYNNTPATEKNWDSFWTFLDSRYADHQQKQNALQKLLNARQSNSQSIRAFLNEFEHNYSLSGNHYDDKSLIAFLQKAIKKELRDPLLVHRFSSFTDYKDALIHYEDALKGSSRLGSYPQSGQPQSQQISDPHPEPMDWEPTQANQARGQNRTNERYYPNISYTNGSNQNAPSRNGSTRNGSNRSDNENPNRPPRRAKWVSYETLSDRRQKKLCMRCGAGGHFIKDCPYLPASRPSQSYQTIPHVPEPELEDSIEQPKE